MKNPSRTNFKLRKISLGKTGGVKVDFDLIEIIGGESYESKESKNSTKEPHPDLADPLKRLAPMVAQVFGFSLCVDAVERKEFKADAIQKDVMRKLLEKYTERIRVNGISISGEEKKRGVVITCGYTVDNNQVVAINTPRILLESETRGFEEDLIAIVDTIESEVFSFVYENKVANPEIFEYSEAEENE